MLDTSPLVTTALAVVSEAGVPLRTVGARPDGPISAGTHKWCNFSMDSMILWDRNVCDPRFDPGVPAFIDFEFGMQLFAMSPGVFHLGTSLHEYVKQTNSISNGIGMTERMVAAKTTLLERLAGGYYPFADPDAAHGIAAFLEISLAAERSFPAALTTRPGLLFEGHLEPMLNSRVFPG